MFAHLVQARLGAAARIATTAFLALLLLVAGWTPARVLPTLQAAGAHASGTLAHQDSSAVAWGSRATAIEAGTPDGSLDASAPDPQRRAFAGTTATATSRQPARAGARLLARYRPRAPPTTV